MKQEEDYNFDKLLPKAEWLRVSTIVRCLGIGKDSIYARIEEGKLRSWRFDGGPMKVKREDVLRLIRPAVE